MPEPERYPLDDAAIALLADIKAQIAPFQQYWEGALALFCRQHKLLGRWQVAANGRELEQVNEELKEMPK